MRPTSHRLFKPLIGASTLVLLVGGRSAYADLWGADMGPLSTLVSQAAVQITQLAETFRTLRETYDEAKRVAGYAQDAYQAFQSFQKDGLALFGGDVEAALDATFPDLAYLRREPSHTGPWAEGTGELQRLVSYCVGNKLQGGTCAQAQEALTLAQVRRSLAATFGEVPQTAPGALETRAMDHEASVAIAASHAQVSRNQVTRLRAARLMRHCTGATDAKALAECQAAASAAAIHQLEVDAELSDQFAEANRLQAARVAQENARRKREVNDAINRRRMLLEGARRMAPPEARFTTQGRTLEDR